MTISMIGMAQVVPDTPIATVRFISQDGEVLQRFEFNDDASFSRVREALQAQLADPDKQIVSVRIRSAASPDGNTDINRALSDRRADDTRLYLLSAMPELYGVPFVVISAGEDYESLRALLEQSDIPGAAQAVEIIRTVPQWLKNADGIVVDGRKKRLMDLRGGETWTAMLPTLFPQLKRTRIEFLIGSTSSDGEHPAAAEQKPLPDIKIYFPVNITTIQEDFRTNAEAFAQLHALMDQRSYTDGDVIRVVGMASPEGTEQLNEYLARGRAESIRKYIASHWPEFADAVSVTVEGEVWADFRAAVQADMQLSAADSRVLDIFDSTSSLDAKEAALRKLPAWQRYYRSLFPDYRTATISPDFVSERPRPRDIGPFLPGLGLGLASPAATLHLDQLRVPAPKPHLRTLRPVFGLSTNLIYDCTYVPNYGLTSIPSVTLEYYPSRSRHFTFGFDVEFPMWQHWDTHRFMQVNNLTLWTRRYFRTREDRFRGTYLLASVNAARFGIGWDAHGWEGEGAGASLGIGHKWLLGRSRLFIDMGVALGAFYAMYDPYVFGNDATRRYYYDYAGDPAKFRERNHRWFWFGPTRAYISLGIDLFNRKRR